MRPANYLSQPSRLLSTWALLVAPAMGAAQPPPDNNPPAKKSPANNHAPDNGGQSSTSQAASSSSKSAPPTSTTNKAASSPTSSAELPPLTSLTSKTSHIASITGPAQSGSFADPTGLPTLSQAPKVIPSVPPTADAPFMRQSHMPDGTVFIAVGAILGAFAIAILAWRAIVRLLLHRSVKKAAMAQHDVNGKAGFPGPPAPFYKYTDQGSTMSLGAAGGRGVRRTTRGPIPSANPSQSNLFFSPTAANANTGGNRSSTFLPSGFYAAGATPSPGEGHGHSISMTNLSPDSREYHSTLPQSTLSPSPPGSPHVGARRDMSTSSLALNVIPGQRTPSAYLDDLLADDPASFPPLMPPSGAQRTSSYGSSTHQSRF